MLRRVSAFWSSAADVKRWAEFYRESPISKGAAIADSRDTVDRFATTPSTSDTRWITRLSVAFSIEAVLLNLLQLPQSLSFSFLFQDMGANITAQYLIAQRYRPTLDFGYHYGLLALLLGHVWFGAVGATPIAYQAAMVITGIVLAFGLAKFAENLNLSWIGITFIATALLIAIRPYYWSFAQAVEAALLCHAIAAQAGGKTRTALALTTAAVFAKPTMAYFYGALLLVESLLRLRAGDRLTWKAVERLITPSIVVGGVLTVLLSAIYGALPLWHTMFPLTGAYAYRVQGLGLLGEGKSFLYSPGVRPGYYAGTFAGVWILGSLWLLGTAAVCASRFSAGIRKHSPVELAAEVVLTCGLLQIIFVTILFGTSASWAYYSYILVMGIAASSALSYRAGNVVLALAFMALLSQKATWQDSIRAWRTTSPDPDALGLWTDPSEAKEWTTVRRLATGKSATILSCDGSAELEFPLFRKPVSLFLLPGLASSSEIERKAAQVSSSSLVIIPRFYAPNYQELPKWPAFAEGLEHFQVIFDGRFFMVLAKAGDSGSYTDRSATAH